MITFLNILILLSAGVIVQAISYWITRPTFDLASIVVLLVLTMLRFIFPVWGVAVSVVLALLLIFIPRVHKLYKIGAVAFLIALPISLVAGYIISHSFLVIPLQPR